MPMYSYECPEGHVFEAFNSMAERENTKCEKCGQEARQIFTPPKKGTGYHAFEETILWADPTTPVRVSDRNQVRDFCRRHGKYAPGILDGQ